MNKLQPLVALVTTPSDLGESIALRIVDEGLAACVNIIPAVRSIYRWEGVMQRDDEALLVLKTLRPAIEPLRRLLQEIHPYDLFELVVSEINDGNPAYLDWIASSVRVPG